MSLTPHSRDDETSRPRLVEMAFDWERRFGVAPVPLSWISEYDVVRLLGLFDDSFAFHCVRFMVVTDGDVTVGKTRFSVNADRPDVRPAAYLTQVAHSSGYGWDKLYWMLYDKQYELCEAWELPIFDRDQDLDERLRLTPADLRRGTRLFPSRYVRSPTQRPETVRFSLGKSYSRAEIHNVVGGGVQDYLPHQDGHVVCGCFNPILNPDAPDIVLPGFGRDIERWAHVFADQDEYAPCFLKLQTNHWEYVGEFRVKGVTTAASEIARYEESADRAGDVSMVLFLEEQG